MTKHTHIAAAIAGLIVGSVVVMPAFADGENVAVLTKDGSNPVFELERQGAANAAKIMNAKVSNYFPTVPNSIAEQTSEIEDVIQTKPAGIFMTPVDRKALGPVLDKVNAAGIPLVQAGDRSETGKLLTYVGVDDYKMALNIARYLLKSIGGKGNVIILEGVKGASTTESRSKAFADALKDYPDVKVLASQTANYQRLEGLQVTENLLQRFPQIDAIMAMNDPMALGAIEGLKAANRQAAVIGFNGSAEAADSIRSGAMLASAYSDTYAYGCAGVYAIVRNARQMPVPETILIPDVVVDKSNVDQVVSKTAERSCPSWEDLVKN